MYSESDGKSDSPLCLKDIQRIDKAEVSHTDKHYLRLLAHCLACFKIMAHDSQSGLFPSETIRMKWLKKQIGYMNDDVFLNLLLQQFESASKQLEELAENLQISPLELTLDHLIHSLESRECS